LLAKYEFEGGLKDEEVMGDLYDFLIAGASFGAIMENQAAELGMRMSSMENATENCGEVLAGEKDGKTLCCEFLNVFGFRVATCVQSSETGCDYNRCERKEGLAILFYS